MIARDVSRSRIYEAEQLVRNAFGRAEETGVRTIEVHGSCLTLPIERRFASVDSVWTYVDRILALDWIRDRWPEAAAPIFVRERAGTMAAHYEFDTATIAVPITGRRWALREFVVLHELAHHLARRTDRAPHGPEFREAYLALVDRIIGAEAAFLLSTSLYACGVSGG